MPIALLVEAEVKRSAVLEEPVVVLEQMVLLVEVDIHPEAPGTVEVEVELPEQDQPHLVVLEEVEVDYLEPVAPGTEVRVLEEDHTLVELEALGVLIALVMEALVPMGVEVEVELMAMPILPVSSLALPVVQEDHIRLVKAVPEEMVEGLYISLPILSPYPELFKTMLPVVHLVPVVLDIMTEVVPVEPEDQQRLLVIPSLWDQAWLPPLPVAGLTAVKTDLMSPLLMVVLEE